jgi:hypothetical protein
MTIIALIALLAAPAAQANDLPLCDFYKEKSKELGCSSDNYLTVFGEKYCREFVELEKDFTPAGVKTFAHIRGCLIESLKEAPELTCANARDIAEHSHVKCYRGSGYCDLPGSDKWVVFRTVWKELFSSGFRSVVSQINEDCANR